MTFERSQRIFVAGHKGLVGSAIVRRLLKDGKVNLLLAERQQVDLRNQSAVQRFFEEERPDVVIMCAATVGGAADNLRYPGQYIYDNLMMQAHVLEASYRVDVKKLLLIGSSYLYPHHAPQPMKEEYLLTGPFEPVKEFYALSKTAGVKMCEAYHRQYGCSFFAVMPPNLYGPGDKYGYEEAHVVAALLRKFHEAKERGPSKVVVWGSGQALREFLHVDDLADACLFLLQHYEGGGWINCGSGEEISVRDLAIMIKEITECPAEISFDPSKPEGAPRRLLDSSRIRALGWQPSIKLKEGLREVYEKHFRNDLLRSRNSA
jgi:GDP-L-fucose synthase